MRPTARSSFYRTGDKAPSQAPGAVLKAPFGALGMYFNREQSGLLGLAYLPESVAQLRPQSELAARVWSEVESYVHDVHHVFDLSHIPLLSMGTEFQHRVWKVIAGLEVGQVLSYQQVGRLIGCGSPRAVGGACSANPYPLIVPCHRVVGTHGIGGFAHQDQGFYVGVKRWLLAREGLIYE